MTPRSGRSETGAAAVLAERDGPPAAAHAASATPVSRRGGAGKVGRAARALATWGPGLLVMIADVDPGNVVTAAQGGASWGYRLLPLALLLIVPLYYVQELTVRLGIFTGRGYSQLVRERYGLGWASVAGVALVCGAVGSLITEFTGVAGIGEIYGLGRAVPLAAAAALVLLIAVSGSYRRIERLALMIGAFEVAFFVFAWQSGPRLSRIAAEVGDIPWRDPGFGLLAAAMIGAAFNPWMIFYQQSATVERGLGPADYRAARWDTAVGAMLAQLLSAAVLVAAAATLGRGGSGFELTSIADIGNAFAAAAPQMSKLVFSLGVLGAALVAVIVSALAVTWGIGEIFGFDHSAGHPMPAHWFLRGYAIAVVGSALFVGLRHNLIGLNIAVQVMNAFLLPVLLVLLICLARGTLVGERRLRGGELVAVAACTGLAAVAGLAGALTFFIG